MIEDESSLKKHECILEIIVIKNTSKLNANANDLGENKSGQVAIILFYSWAGSHYSVLFYVVPRKSASSGKPFYHSVSFFVFNLFLPLLLSSLRLLSSYPSLSSS